MSILSTFHAARKFFEVNAAYNVDRFRFQSMVSTAHKMLTLERAIVAGKSQDDIAKGVASVSEYWFYKTIHSPIFAEHMDSFLRVDNWCKSHGIAYDTSEAQFHTDSYCRHMLLMSPFTGGHEVFDLETGKAFTVATLPTKNPTLAGVIHVEGKPTPLYNFTRRECDAKSGGLINHQASH